MRKKELIGKSRLLSYYLRHSYELVDKKGWANIDDILNKIKCSLEELMLIVDTNDKQRFELSEDKKKIRARQGHSIDVDVELEEAKPTSDLYHGTSSYYLDSILKNGINKKDRLFVHLADSIDLARKSGSRHGGESKVIVIDVESMINDGEKFFHSRNNVWLTEFIDRKYIKSII